MAHTNAIKNVQVWEWNHDYIIIALDKTDSVSEFAVIDKWALAAYRAHKFVLHDSAFKKLFCVVNVETASAREILFFFFIFLVVFEGNHGDRVPDLVTNSVEVFLILWHGASNVKTFENSSHPQILIIQRYLTAWDLSKVVHSFFIFLAIDEKWVQEAAIELIIRELNIFAIFRCSNHIDSLYDFLPFHSFLVDRKDTTSIVFQAWADKHSASLLVWKSNAYLIIIWFFYWSSSIFVTDFPAIFLKIPPIGFHHIEDTVGGDTAILSWWQQWKEFEHFECVNGDSEPIFRRGCKWKLE